MKFLEPDMLWNLAWVLPLMIVVCIVAEHRRRKAVAALTGSGMALDLSPAKRVCRFLILLLCIVSLVVALARPSWDFQIQEIKGSGRDLMVIFDVSKSMLCRDVQPSRLEHAKWVIRELVKKNPGDRFGLIAFAGSAFMECPLTIDRNSFLQDLADLDTSVIPRGGTNVQAALEEALSAFQAAESPHRAVILVTDGDELEGQSSKAVEELVRRKIPLFVIGIGDPSQPSIIQVSDGKGNLRTLKDAAGNIVNSPLNEKQLTSLASAAGGIYVRSTAVNTGVDSVEKRIRSLDSGEFESFRSVKPIERFQWPLGIAFSLFLLWLSTGERRRIPRTLLLLSAFLLFAGEIRAQEPAPAKKTEAPAVRSADELYNDALELQKKGDLKGAAEGYQKVLASPGANPLLRGRAMQNSGVLLHTQGRSSASETRRILAEQKLQEALKNTESSLKNYQEAETFYREAMRSLSDTSGLSDNQTGLLEDRKKAEDLKKQIEELIRKQQEARERTKQARDQQKQQNNNRQKQQNQQQNQQQQSQQQQNQQQNQQQQNQQQNQQQQSQQQQNQQQNQQQQNNNRQNDLHEKTRQAEQSASQMKEQAGKLGQKEMQKQAEQAEQELKQAGEAQKRGADKSAEEHLDKAVQALGENPAEDPKDKQNKGGDKGKNPQNQPDKQPQIQPEKQPRQPKSQPAAKSPDDKRKTDKEQAAAILESMAKDERDLKRELKRYKNGEIPPVEKDW